jgi:hypothetical protein
VNSAETEMVIEDTETNGSDSKQEYERSTISFPYGDLDDAVEVAKALHDHRGGRSELGDLAAVLHHTVKSGTFRVRMATARIFGVIEGRGTVSLSQLGQRIVDSKTEKQARVDAFLQVPLYKAIYDNHAGATLPGDKGLENEMKELGVSEKQAHRARQAFQRSAEQAGFFAHGKDRLVKPALSSTPDADPDPGDHESGRQGATGFLPDAIQAAWITLLDEGASWSDAEQLEWIKLARRQRAILTKATKRGASSGS